jgi:hypothetical protein
MTLTLQRPIKTYNGMGVAAPGVVKAHHVVVYTMPIRPPAPECMSSEVPTSGREAPMQRQAILVINRDRTRPLDPISRLDFFDIHRFDVNLKHVSLYGQVHPEHIVRLVGQYQAVWASFALDASQLTGLPSLPTLGTVEASHLQPATRASSISAQASSGGPGSTSASSVVRSPYVSTPASGRSAAASAAHGPPRSSSLNTGTASSSIDASQLRAMIVGTTVIEPGLVSAHLTYLRRVAQARNLAAPPDLNAVQINGLAQTPEARRQWFAQVHRALGV